MPLILNADHINAISEISLWEEIPRLLKDRAFYIWQQSLQQWTCCWSSDSISANLYEKYKNYSHSQLMTGWSRKYPSFMKENDNDTMIIVSSDLSHFHAYQKQQSLTGNAWILFWKMNIKKCIQRSLRSYPIIVLMNIATHFGWKAELMILGIQGYCRN